MKKITCWILGHDYRYNFASQPDKCICARCKRKWFDAPITRDWVEVDKFTFTKGCERTDDELIKAWIRL